VLLQQQIVLQAEVQQHRHSKRQSKSVQQIMENGVRIQMERAVGVKPAQMQYALHIIRQIARTQTMVMVNGVHIRVEVADGAHKVVQHVPLMMNQHV